MVVTGGSSGIGLAAAVALARAGDEVVLLGRDPGRLQHAVDAVREAGGRTPAAYRADFAVLDEVREAGAKLVADHERIAVLVNNAGQLAPARRLTADGLDPTMQVNHLAGFLLTHLLFERLLAGATTTAPARIITTSSAAEAWGTLDVARPGRRQVSRWLAYGASKQANVLFTVEAARRWTQYGVVPTCFFPGLIRSRFGRRSPMFSLAKLAPGLFRSAEQGAETLLWLADADEALVPGGYFAWKRPFGATGRSTNADRARRLWQSSLTAVGLEASTTAP
ncbi:SDR family NAD(P)-dependent oxidoreductase [Actinoplanes friuliensis]|uniref:Short-chain dehydrogenase/reductase SDR n=1 Tax=Actinoplanes friuliensis DSM 7358 TaxID=1246995 RepID=U5WBU2_9ACTN|nr:SDR family NAD(P)-dependent oxidoreductase [Actinoplanes friuliensis]AGZ45470.1 short-chain dehydrogenase/reductase SDR [Actinoplanes friuliensis DSM 7358]